MYPWAGQHITLLTISEGLDPEAMEGFVSRLDEGWELYQNFTGKSPRLFKHLDGKATICALPKNDLTCGYGCGYVGATGIEIIQFYGDHLPSFKKNPKTMPHAYYYEMGRNFYTFGHKHSVFTTGFAVFMRYVCIDSLKGIDQDGRTRKTINDAIDDYVKSDLTFLKTFTNSYGLTEKDHRLPKRPTDQNVLYASAMLKLWKEHGDHWLKSFYHHLDTAPAQPGQSKEGARLQCLSWYLASSLAAKKDLAPTFVDQWRFQLTEAEKTALKKIKWDVEKLTVSELIKQVGK